MLHLLSFIDMSRYESSDAMTYQLGDKLNLIQIGFVYTLICFRWVSYSIIFLHLFIYTVLHQELPTLPEHLIYPLNTCCSILSVLWNVLYVCFVDRCLSFYLFSFGHCVVCSSSIYGL